MIVFEKEKELGGNVRESFYTLKGSNPQALLKDLIDQVEKNELIHSYLEAEVIGFEKKNGHCKTKIRHQNEEKVLEHGV
ncbi:MAG: hypothetical protein ONB05_04655, partial [candidate division KSB1 bacterium]|nr:hypothetical protein [candidate division KSB1 bacterium]